MQLRLGPEINNKSHLSQFFKMKVSQIRGSNMALTESFVFFSPLIILESVLIQFYWSDFWIIWSISIHPSCLSFFPSIILLSAKNKLTRNVWGQVSIHPVFLPFLPFPSLPLFLFFSFRLFFYYLQKMNSPEMSGDRYLSICLSIYPSVCPSVYPFVCPFICPSVCPSIHPSIHLILPQMLEPEPVFLWGFSSTLRFCL